MGSLKISFILSLCFLHLCLLTNGQSVELPFSAASISWYSGNLYSFGLEEKDNSLHFTIQQLDNNLLKRSSQTYTLTVQKNEEKVACWSDTLHGSLNVYVSEGRNQKVSVFRFTRKFELLNRSNGVEISRLNTLSGFDNELFYENSNVYAIKTKSDTSGKQFYLNKYLYKEEVGGLEYKLEWQFPFERKNISFSRVFYANKDHVFLFVVVKSGEKMGQWILKVNANKGYLVKGTKLNDKGDENTYCFGNYYYDKDSKKMILIGHKFNSKQMAPGSDYLASSTSTAVSLFLSEIDSIGDQIVKQEIKLPVIAAKSGGKITPLSYLLQIQSFQKIEMDYYKVVVDVYKKISSVSCYTYANSFSQGIKKEEEKYHAEKKNISSEPLIDTYLFSNDKLDMNGKLCQDSLTIYKLFYKAPSLPVKLFFGEDSLHRPLWLLNKSHLKKGSINYSVLKAGKKTYELAGIEEIQKSQAPICIPLPGNFAVIGRQIESFVYRIQLNNLEK